MYFIKKFCFNWRFLKKKLSNSFFFRYFKKIYYESEINKKMFEQIVILLSYHLRDYCYITNHAASAEHYIIMYFVPKDLHQIPRT